MDDCSTKLKKGSEEMEEKVNAEISSAAKVLGLPIEEVREKWDSLVRDNDLTLEDENEVKLGLVLFRQWFGGMKRVSDSGETRSTSSLVNTGFGTIVAVEEARDFEQFNRDKLQAEFLRNKDEAFNAGKFAYAEETSDGGYMISQVLNGELSERTTNAKGEPYTELPDSVMDIEGTLIIPIDDREELPWGKNKSFGRPLPLSNWRRTVHFIGQVGEGEIRYWRISSKDSTAENWNVDGQRFVYLDGIWNDEKGEMYPVKQTLENVIYNDSLDNPKDVSAVNYSNLVTENMRHCIAPLVNLEHYHNSVKDKPVKERIVVTDGNIVNMNMNQNVTGNRTLLISDVNADYDYDTGGYSSTPCWVPANIDIDFGIGSHVLIIGRPNQSTDKDTGELRQVSINVFGIIVLDRRGAPVEITDSGEQYSGWF